MLETWTVLSDFLFTIIADNDNIIAILQVHLHRCLLHNFFWGNLIKSPNKWRSQESV